MTEKPDTTFATQKTIKPCRFAASAREQGREDAGNGHVSALVCDCTDCAREYAAGLAEESERLCKQESTK